MPSSESTQTVFTWLRVIVAVMKRPAAFQGPIAMLLLISFAHSSVNACTTFRLSKEDSLVIGHNFDWRLDAGLVFINKRCMVKPEALVHPAPPYDEKATWTSKYGSITFNQWGRELPQAGMNEAGLVVAWMELDGTEFPVPDERPTIGLPQWIQYQLDNCSCVGEVIATDSDIRINVGEPKCHFLVADASGDVAIIEWLEGEMVVHDGDSLLIAALMNDTYDASVDYAKQFDLFGGDQLVEGLTAGSLDRFVQVGARILQFEEMTEVDAVDYAFETLQIARQEITMWSIVFDVENRVVGWRTMRSPEIVTVDLSALDFSGATPHLLLGVNAELSGDVTNDFVDYNTEINRELVYEIWEARTPHSQVTWDMVAEYPESFWYDSTK